LSEESETDFASSRKLTPGKSEASSASSPSRPPARQAMREEDPREAAAKRAQEIRKHLGGMDEGIDDYYVDPSDIPPGWTYEWKRKTVLGQEDPAYQIGLMRRGWEYVPASRHPHMMPDGWTGNTIERKGAVLMMRPEEITNDVRRLDYRRAREQVRVKEQQLSAAPDGQFTRDHDKVKPKISKGYEPMPIPND